MKKREKLLGEEGDEGDGRAWVGAGEDNQMTIDCKTRFSKNQESFVPHLPD